MGASFPPSSATFSRRAEDGGASEETPSRSDRPLNRAHGSRRQCFRLDGGREDIVRAARPLRGGGPRHHRHGGLLLALGAGQQGRRVRDHYWQVDEEPPQPRQGDRCDQGRLRHGAGPDRPFPPYLEKAAEASLKRLQTDYIDLYLSHWPDPTTPYDETLGAYQKLLAAGKVRNIGCSNLDTGQLTAALSVASQK